MQQKLETCKKEDMPQPELFGPEQAEVTLVSWGSNKGPILQAMKEFDNVNFLHLTWVNPFPAEYVRQVLENAKHVVNIEANFTLQMRGWIKEQTGFDITDNFNKYDGRPFYMEELVEKINSLMKGGT